MSVSARSIRSVSRLSAVLTLAWGAAGCSTVDGWVDSVTGSSTEASTSVSPPSDQDGTADQPGGQTVAEASDQYPTIADQPDKAPPSSSTDEQKQVAEGLTADRSQAQYSADALRGGTEPAAAPPPPAPPPAPKTADAAPPAPEPAAATASDSDASADRSAGDLPTGKAPMPGALPAIQGGPQVASAAPATTPTAPPPAAVTTTSMPESAAMPAPPPPPASFARAAPPPTVQPMSQSDAALGFQPSHAPPLDASVSQFVSPAVLDRYQQTAAMSSAPGIAGTSRVSHARRHVRHHKKAAAEPAPE